MRKIPLYFAIAVVMGLLVMLVPLVAFIELKVENNFLAAESFSRGVQGIEGSYGSGAAKLTVFDFQVPIISFVIAIAVYLLVRRKV